MEIWLMISKVGLSDKLESSRVISCLDTETCPSSGGRAKFVFFFKFELGRQLARRAALALLLVHITAPSRSSCSMQYVGQVTEALLPRLRKGESTASQVVAKAWWIRMQSTRRCSWHVKPVHKLSSYHLCSGENHDRKKNKQTDNVVLMTIQISVSAFTHSSVLKYWQGRWFYKRDATEGSGPYLQTTSPARYSLE